MSAATAVDADVRVALEAHQPATIDGSGGDCLEAVGVAGIVNLSNRRSQAPLKALRYPGNASLVKVCASCPCSLSARHHTTPTG